MISQNCARLKEAWVVIPAYHEKERIGAVLDELLRFVDNIVVVDDGSSDSTPTEVLKRPVWLLRHAVNLGQGAALQTGITFALFQNAQCIVTFDADGQHAPNDIPALVHALASRSADYALGSRFLGTAIGIPTARKIVLRLGVLFTRLFSGIGVSDTHNGFRAMTREGAKRIRLTLNRMEHASEILDQIAASGLKYVEVPVNVRYTRETLAKGQRSSAALKLALKVVIESLFK